MVYARLKPFPAPCHVLGSRSPLFLMPQSIALVAVKDQAKLSQRSALYIGGISSLVASNERGRAYKAAYKVDDSQCLTLEGKSDELKLLVRFLSRVVTWEGFLAACRCHAADELELSFRVAPAFWGGWLVAAEPLYFDVHCATRHTPDTPPLPQLSHLTCIRFHLYIHIHNHRCHPLYSIPAFLSHQKSI